MNSRRWVAGLWALCVLLSTPARAQGPAPAPATGAAASSDALARPADDRSVLHALAGSWNIDATQFLRGQPPVKVVGTSENTWVVGGRFLQCATRIGEAGTTVEGLTTYGYDGGNHEYFAVGVNTSPVPFSAMHGPYYDGSRSLVLRSETASSGGVRFKRRNVIRLEGNDRYVVEVFLESVGAPPVKVLEAVHTRR